MENKLKIAVVINVMPSYRKGFYTRLFERNDLDIKVYCQESIPGSNLKTIHNLFPNNVILVPSLTAKNEEIVWQSIPWREILNDYDVVFVEGNPRYITHAILATLMKLFRKKIILWTMAHSFRANILTENIRLLWSRIFDYLFVYSDTEVMYLRAKGFRSRYIVGMNNGLDQNNIDKVMLECSTSKLRAWRSEQSLDGNILLLSCARLESKNKFMQFVQALPAIVDEFPEVIWCLIGEGGDKSELVTMVEDAKLTKHVRFLGAIYGESELAPWFMSSNILIHPAAIGLTIFHAFGYGLPVVTHGNWERHGPEYAAFEPGLTGLNFIEDDVGSLSEVVVKLLKDSVGRNQMSDHVKMIAREKYNVDIMAERFANLAHIAAGRKIKSDFHTEI
jgi:glycosyltransferase involved in cell wall biosynthesis